MAQESAILYIALMIVSYKYYVTYMGTVVGARDTLVGTLSYVNMSLTGAQLSASPYILFEVMIIAIPYALQRGPTCLL